MSRTLPVERRPRDDAAAVPARPRPAAAAVRASGPLVLGLSALAGTVLVGAVSPEQPGHYPVCPTLALTGFSCPGCGGLRAVHALVHGDLGLALHRNPLVVIGLPFVVWAYLAWLRRRVLDRPVRRLPPAAAWWAFGALLVAFTVARNLPGTPWLGP